MDEVDEAKDTAARRYDAVIVGSGPNGLAAAITLAEAGLSTLVIEGAQRPGGGMRSAALTLPGFVHDVCSAVHPLGVGSPFFRALPLHRHGLSWIDSPDPLVHVISEHEVAVLARSLDDTAAQMGPDGPAYRRLMKPLVRDFDTLAEAVLGPLRVPRAPLAMARFGIDAIRSMNGLARAWFRTEAPPALLGGIAAHAMVPLHELATASFALVLAMAGHAVGWPIARGGSQAIADALIAYLRALGGEIVLGRRVTSLRELPPARAYLLDVSPEQLARIAGDRLGARYLERLGRFRYGPGVYKIDWALDGPIPWIDPRCRRAVTAHLSGTLAQIGAAEAMVHDGELAERPFVLLGQPSIVDPTRAPDGKHTAWAYCHVPHGSTVDARDRIEALVERFAPGFGRSILARATHDATQIERESPNYVGGDINGGLADLRQLFFRPMPRLDPYATPASDVFLCSSSTPPGGGVHGMCGYWAAQSALRRVFGHR